MIDEIRLAWESIQTAQGTTGWSTVAIFPFQPGRFRAGRNFPDKCEALLACFHSNVISQNEKLPEGRGFHVTLIPAEQNGFTWLALTRSPNGDLELFSAMVSDVLQAVLAFGLGNHSRDLRVFLARIRAWQEFMRKGITPLSAENEVGLVGELNVLEKILDAGVAPDVALQAWTGPFDGLRDFVLGFGAIEIKTTIASTGLVAKIGSLEQLDDTNCKPIFLGAVKCLLSQDGRTLPETISIIRNRFAAEKMMLSDFDDRVLAAGYLEMHTTHYHRRFSLTKILVIEVNETFPRLTHGDVKPGVINARYEINLEPLLSEDIGLTAALRKLEVI